MECRPRVLFLLVEGEEMTRSALQLTRTDLDTNPWASPDGPWYCCVFLVCGFSGSDFLFKGIQR